MRVQGLCHLHLLVRDAERSARFYREAFGLEEAFRVHGGRMVFMRIPGGGLLTVNEDEDRPEAIGAGGIDHFSFAFPDDYDRDQAIADALTAGATIVEQGEHRPGVPYTYIADPDGYRIEL